MGSFRDEVVSATEEILLPAIVKVLAPLADQKATIDAIKVEIASILSVKHEEARVELEAKLAAEVEAKTLIDAAEAERLAKIEEEKPIKEPVEEPKEEIVPVVEGEEIPK